MAGENMKIKLLTILLISLLAFPISVFASLNTYSTDLERDNNQYWSITDANQTGLDITGDMTIELWVKPETIVGVGEKQRLVTKWDTSNKSYSFQLGEGTIEVNITSDGSTANLKTVTWSPSTGTWYHLAVSYDASAGSATFYLNGSQQGTTQTGLPTSIYDGTASVLIGETSDAGDQSVDGLIDEVRIWNDIRTSTEIADNYQKELTGSEANLQGYWKFNNNGNDATSNSNDLTNNNSATFSSSVPFVGSSDAIETKPLIFGVI